MPRKHNGRVDVVATGAPSAPGRPDIAARVLRYFEENAQAMDSVEGIARVWVREDPRIVARCLEDLHARGLLDRRAIAGTDFYSARRSPASPRGVAAGRVEGASSPQSDPAPAPQAKARGRVLVIDDDAGARGLLVEVLRGAGHLVEEAEGGERGLEMFRADPHEVVVTDLVMPESNGMEVLRSVKQTSPATEVIVVTAYASLETAIKALRHGAYDLITKPLDDVDLLVRVVGRALEKRRLAADNCLLVQNLQARNLELKRTVARLAAVYEIGQATAGLLDLPKLYETLARLMAQHLEARRVSILISDSGRDELELVASVGITEKDVQGRRLRLEQGIAGRVAASLTPLLVSDIGRSDLRALSSGGRYTTSSFVSVPVRFPQAQHSPRTRIGVINVSDKHSGDPFTEQDLEFLTTLAGEAAVAIENALRVREMDEAYVGALAGVIQAAEEARGDTRGHSPRVARLAAAVARSMGVSDTRVETLVRAAALHAAGRLPGRDILETEKILRPIASLQEVREIILHSAEPFDGGLPLAAARRVVPLESRILAACEEYARLIAGDGKDAEGRRRVLDTLRGQAGRRHDPEVVSALCRVVGEGGAS